MFVNIMMKIISRNYVCFVFGEKILPGILHDDGTYELIKLGNDEVTWQNRLHWHMLQQRIRYTCKETDLE